jgi:hypothetical protein
VVPLQHGKDDGQRGIAGGSERRAKPTATAPSYRDDADNVTPVAIWKAG